MIKHAEARLALDNDDALASGRRVWYSRLIWLAVASACVVASFYLIRKARSAGEDSWFPMSRALDFLHQSAGGQVYQALFFSNHIKFQYPPSGLLLLDFLRRLGVDSTAQLNWINAWLLIASGLAFAVFAVQLLGSLRWFGHRIPVGPIAFLVAVEFYPNRLALQFGQIQILLGLLFLFSCLATFHKRHLLAGCLIACAATVKPQFLLFGLLMLWQKNWRFLAGFVFVTCAALGLSIWLYGWQNHLDYLKVLGFLSQHGEYHHLNQTINGILNRYLYDGPSVDYDPDNPVPNSGFPPYIPIVYGVTTLTSLLLLAIPFSLRRAENDLTVRLARFCAAAILFTMASPIAWAHHYNVLLPGYVVALKLVLDRGQSERVWLSLLIIGISFALTGLQLAAPFGPTVPSLNLLQSHVFFGALLLVGVLLFELFSLPNRSPVRRTEAPNSM
jgi:hypothetical protein